MDGEAIKDFAFNSFKLFAYSFFYFSRLLCAENFVKIWPCGVAKAGDASFFEKKITQDI